MRELKHYKHPLLATGAGLLIGTLFTYALIVIGR